MERFVRRTVKTEEVEQITINDTDLLKFLNIANTDYRIFVTVPGGGDWSNTELDIDNRCPITIQVTKKDIISEDI